MGDIVDRAETQALAQAAGSCQRSQRRQALPRVGLARDGLNDFMHPNSVDHMRALVQRYLEPGRSLLVGDVGSYDEKANYRALVADPAWKYVGIDVIEGPNVDVVLTSPYQFPFPDGHFDALISGQAFEHVKFFWLTWMEMVRTLRPGGYIFLIAPSRGHEHRFPLDCWRFYPDGYRALAEYGQVDCLEVHTDWPAYPGARGRKWGDTVGAFAKRPYELTHRAAAWLRGPGAAPVARGAAERVFSHATNTLEAAAQAIVRRLRHSTRKTRS